MTFVRNIVYLLHHESFESLDELRLQVIIFLVGRNKQDFLLFSCFQTIFFSRDGEVVEM